MTNRAAAVRYARALFDVALKEADVEQAGQDLARFQTLIDSHATLRLVLTNPAVPVHRKRAVVSELLARAGDTAQPVARLMMLLAERDRLALLPDIVEAYRERLMERQRIVRAQVTTAKPLAPEQSAALEARLAVTTGKRVIMTTAVDPSLIGGAVTRLGGVVYDGSVVRQLERLKQQLRES